MLQCYMDDSGSHDEAENCVFGGYWGSDRVWREFEWEWKRVLESEGIEEFHAKKFWPRFNGQRLKPYSGWNDERHRSFIDRLLSVIEDSRITPFVCGVLNADWEKVPLAYRRAATPRLAREKNDDLRPLYLSFSVAVVKAAAYCKPGIRMHFFVDNGPLAGRIAQRYSDLKKSAEEDRADDLRFALGQLTLADSKIATPLQAADLLAYEAHRYGKSKRGDRNAPVRSEYRRALKRMKTIQDFWMFDGPRLQEMQETLDELVKQGGAK